MFESSDPTRIPRVIAALERAWEGQPDLPLTTLMGILANRGISWGASDDELVDALAQLEAEHPATVEPTPPHDLTITTTDPARAVTLSGGYAIVRDPQNPSAMPSVWRYESLRRTGPGRPLVIRDTESIEHRIGVVRLVSRLCMDRPLDGLHHGDVGGGAWLVAFEGGARAVVGRSITVWTPGRRDVDKRSLRWEQIASCGVGEQLRVVPAGGGEPSEIGLVERVVYLGEG
ncbi:hypothetical protein [Corynebacterium sp. LK2510]|uniref:hypothetical protein n=1 Tax=Corynebacterium sp. LK2510 TaxID=3110472 RepID=UPI0034CDCD77